MFSLQFHYFFCTEKKYAEKLIPVQEYVKKILLILQYQHVNNEFSERAVLYDARTRHTELVQFSSILADLSLSVKMNPDLQNKSLVTNHLSCGTAQVVCTVHHF